MNGAAANRPGIRWPQQAKRMLGTEGFNIGFGGLGLMELCASSSPQQRKAALGAAFALPLNAHRTSSLPASVLCKFKTPHIKQKFGAFVLHPSFHAHRYQKDNANGRVCYCVWIRTNIKQAWGMVRHVPCVDKSIMQMNVKL